MNKIEQEAFTQKVLEIINIFESEGIEITAGEFWENMVQVYDQATYMNDVDIYVKYPTQPDQHISFFYVDEEKTNDE